MTTPIENSHNESNIITAPCKQKINKSVPQGFLVNQASKHNPAEIHFGKTKRETYQIIVSSHTKQLTVA